LSREIKAGLEWQSKAILLLVLPWTVVSVLLQSHWWFSQVPVVAWTTLGISSIFGLIVWRMRAGTPGAAATGAAICASLMFSSAGYPYQWSWLYGALPPLLAVFLLTYAATKIGKAKKEELGTGEGKRGRNSAQVAANLGIAAIVATLGAPEGLPNWMLNSHIAQIRIDLVLALAPMIAIAPLAEAAADTVSSEIGQVFGGEPRLIVSGRRVPRGTDGGITLVGTMAGLFAALMISAIATLAAAKGEIFRHLEWCFAMFAMTASGGIFGLLFDSLLGQTLERKGLLNNDAVNFLSTLSAAALVILEICLIGFPIKG